MSALIYKIASTLFTLTIVGRVLFLIFKKLSPLLKRAVLLFEKCKPKAFQLSEGEKNKIWFADYQRREKEKNEIIERAHYSYKNTYINLSLVVRDRKRLFTEFWTDWKFNSNNCELVSPGDYHSQCIKMFGEMAFARKFLIAKQPTFWTEEKEKFWRKICHPAIAKNDVREQNLFDTRQRIIAEEAFNQGDDSDSQSI